MTTVVCTYCKREHDIWDECEDVAERHSVRHRRQERQAEEAKRKKSNRRKEHKDESPRT